MLLTFALVNVGVARLISTIGAGDDSCARAALTVLSRTYLLLIFGMEAFALPFSTKEGHIAFTLLDQHGLWITVYVLLAIVAGALVYGAWLRYCIDDRPYDEFLEDMWIGLVMVAVFAAGVHLLVGGVWHIVDRWHFIDETLFFVAFKKDLLLYRVLRTAFSTLTVLEVLLWHWASVASVLLDGKTDVDPPREGFFIYAIFGIMPALIDE